MVAIGPPHLANIPFIKVHDGEGIVAVGEGPSNQIQSAAYRRRSVRVVVSDIESAAALVHYYGWEILVKDVVLNLGAAVRPILVTAVEVKPAVAGTCTAVMNVAVAHLKIKRANDYKVIAVCVTRLYALQPTAIAELNERNIRRAGGGPGVVQPQILYTTVSGNLKKELYSRTARREVIDQRIAHSDSVAINRRNHIDLGNRTVGPVRPKGKIRVIEPVNLDHRTNRQIGGGCYGECLRALGRPPRNGRIEGQFGAVTDVYNVVAL